MRKIAVVVAVAAIALAVFLLRTPTVSNIAVTDATVTRMADGSYMTSARITNNGGPEQFIAASLDGFLHAHLMGGTGPVVIPGGASVLLAGDGVHVMAQSQSTFEDGQLIPITLKFENAGNVSARARYTSSEMDHSAMTGFEGVDVSIEFLPISLRGKDGVSGAIKVDGVNLISRPDGTPHQSGEGHAHVYLNGLKLQRLHEPEFTIGALRPGAYMIRVSLNTNDHQPYVQDGIPVAAEYVFTVD